MWGGICSDRALGFGGRRKTLMKWASTPTTTNRWWAGSGLATGCMVTGSLAVCFSFEPTKCELYALSRMRLPFTIFVPAIIKNSVHEHSATVRGTASIVLFIHD